MTTAAHHVTHGAPHVEHVADELDQPCSSETAKKLIEKLGLSEREARLLLEAPAVNEQALAAAMKVNLHAIANAFSSATVSALANDPKIEIGVALTRFSEAAGHVRTLESAIDKLNELHNRALANARMDADTLEHVANSVLPQLRVRARLSSAVRETYSGLFVYYHARHPGSHHRDHGTAPTAAPTNGH